MTNRPLELLHAIAGPDATFRPGQREAIDAVVTERGLLLIDEAHCISDWGHDFRPDSRRLVRVLELLPDGVPVLCTTATANDRVIEDSRAELEGSGMSLSERGSC